MTYRDQQGRLFQPGVIADIPSGNLVWVDAVNGNDSLAVRGRMTIPFKTLSAAKTAATSGDTIIVMPGTYDANSLAKNGVNWHFLSGAAVQYTGTGSAIFDTTGGSQAFKVSGRGVFKTTNASPVRAFYLINSGDDVTLEFDRIEAKAEGIYSLGKLLATGNEAKSTSGSALYLAGSSESLLNIVRVEAAITAVWLNGSSTSCIVRLHASSILSSTGYTVFFQGGTGYIDAFEITSAGSTYASVNYDCASNHPLHLRVSRIINLVNSASARAVLINGGSGGLRLYGCTLYSKYGDYSISAGSSSNVLCMLPCAIKKGASSITALIHSFVDLTNNQSITDL